MSPQEMAFILKMHDEATATLKKIGTALKGMGNEAGDAKDDTEKLGDSLTRLKKTAVEVTAAVGGIWASMKGIRATTTAFGTYELGLVGVQKTTNMTKGEMDEFARSFDQLNAKMNGIDTTELLGMAEAAGQMGVRGTQNLTAFTDVMGKLGVTTDIAGQEGSQAVGRLIALTGELNPTTLKNFGDSLNYLGNTSKATESEILSMSTMIAQSTAGMNLSTDAVLALAAASKEVGLRDELTGSAFGRTLRNLKDGSANATKGFKTFLQVTGMTKKEFDELAKEHPEQVLLRFAEAYAALQPTGKSAGFLDQLGLNTDEIKRVFGTMGTQVEQFQKKLSDLQSGQQEGALDQEAEKFFGASQNQIEGMLKAWEQVKAAIGEALAPLVGPAVTGLTAVFNYLANSIKQMPGPMKTLVASALLLAPAIIGAIKAMALLRVAFAALGGRGGLAAKLLGGQAAMAAAGDTLGAVAGTAAGTKFGKTMTRILGGLKLAVKVAIYFEIAKAVGEGIGSAINKFAPEAASAFADWRDDPSNPIGRFINGAGSLMGVQKGGSKWDKPPEPTPQQQAQEAKRALAAGEQTGAINTDVDVPNPNTAGSKSIDDIVKGLKDQIADAKALTGVAKERVELERTIRETVEETGVSYEEARRQVGGLVTELQKAKAAAAVVDVLRGYDDQINAARAVTGEEKLQVDVQKQINDLEREYGNITQANKEAIADKARAAFDAQRAVSYQELIRSTNQQLAALTAVTTEEKSRADVIQQILEFERERGQLSDQDRQVLATKLMQVKQIAEFQRMADQYDPVGTARRRYEEELRTLEVMRQQKAISEDQYSRMRQNLDERTRAQRDPVGDRVKTLREELNILRMNVDVQDRERSILQEINNLKQAGVDLSSEQGQQMAQAVREYYTAMEQYQRASTQGIGGWINEVGTLRDNMMGLTKDFASGLSGAISGALAGDSNAFRNFAQMLGRKMIETGVNQLMAQAFKGLGFQNPQEKALDRASAAINKIEALGSTLQTPQAIVNAGTVNLNGQALDQALKSANDNLNSLGTQTGGIVPGAANDNAVSGLFSGANGKTLQLSPQDIIDLKKTVATEWVRSAGDMQGKGIIDTILNRQASGKWGNSVADVVNARSQFSDINGAVAWRQGRNSVDDISMSRVSPEVSRLVDDYLAQRASGTSSAVGDNLNYANPNYSDKRNLGWINGLQGPTLGRGDAIHKHGTTPDLQQYRPGDFQVALPGQGQTPQVDTSAITAATQQVQQATQQMGTSLQAVTPQLQQAGMTMQQTGTSVQMGTQQASTAMQTLNTAQQQTGQAATTTGQQFQQAGQQIAAAGTQATSAAGGAGGGGGFAALAGQIASAAGGGGAGGAGGAGGMGSILNSMLPMLMNFLPPPFNLLGGLFGSIFGGLFADGGKIKGPGTGTSDSILAAVSNGEFIVNAKSTKEWAPVLQAINDNKMPKFAKGGQVGGGNVVAIGERAMSSGRTQGATAEVQELAGQVADLTKAVGRANGNGRGRVSNNAVNMTVNARDADSFRRSESQLLADASLKLNRLGARNN